MDAHQAWLESHADNDDTFDEKRAAQDEKDYYDELYGRNGWSEK